MIVWREHDQDNSIVTFFGTDLLLSVDGSILAVSGVDISKYVDERDL